MTQQERNNKPISTRRIKNQFSQIDVPVTHSKVERSAKKYKRWSFYGVHYTQQISFLASVIPE